jgi:hypothetical protein
MASNRVVVRLRPGSDADSIHIPKQGYYTQVNPPMPYLEKIADQWMAAKGNAQPDCLPAIQRGSDHDHLTLNMWTSTSTDIPVRSTSTFQIASTHTLSTLWRTVVVALGAPVQYAVAQPAFFRGPSRTLLACGVEVWHRGIVLYIRDLPEGAELSRHEVTDELQLYDEEKGEFKTPGWRAGLVTETAPAATIADLIKEGEASVNVAVDESHLRLSEYTNTPIRVLQCTSKPETSTSPPGLLRSLTLLSDPSIRCGQRAYQLHTAPCSMNFNTRNMATGRSPEQRGYQEPGHVKLHPSR